MNKNRIRVGVVYGGRSAEHGVSCETAAGIMRNLDPRRFDVVGLGITTEGTWVQTNVDLDRLAINAGQLPHITESWGTVVGIEEALASVDVVFPFAEDVNIQGLLELTAVPYVGPDVFGSVAGADKELTKTLLAADGFSVAEFVTLRAHEDKVQPEQLERLGLPLFVKPARGGSSIGVHRVATADELPAAIADARRYDRKVLVEAAVCGRELWCGLLEFPDGTVEASAVGEVSIEDGHGREGGFYDFATKYFDGVSHLDAPTSIDEVPHMVVPAMIDDDVCAEVRRLAIKAFHATESRGLSRIDFFLTDNGLVVNEINPIPALTTVSMYPLGWAICGMDHPTLLATMVETALARGTR
jgi:D-alanine-D-alanine ligase